MGIDSCVCVCVCVSVCVCVTVILKRKGLRVSEVASRPDIPSKQSLNTKPHKKMEEMM